jgi:hypothetical protein
MCLLAPSLHAQQTIGLFSNLPGAYNGYTLFNPIASDTTYLINNCGERVHTWHSQYRPNLSCYLLENGLLARTGLQPGAGGFAGVELLDWNSNVVWSYSVSTSVGAPHHDIAVLPNGNILMVVSDSRTQAEVIQAGSNTGLGIISSEQLIEVSPDLVNGGGTIVWTWKVWDHLIQDAGITFPNYGVISAHPERINVNFGGHATADWLHINAVAYNARFDQVMLSVHNFSELWVIDHSTTSAQAAGSTGGTYGKGGDLLYRWGNPQAYNQGTAADQKLFQQHNTHWIPDALPDAGKILVFNNKAGTPVGQNYSSVNIISPPVDTTGHYAYGGGAYGPAVFDWTYTAPVPTDFFSNNISGAQRLPNGNTLICEGTPGNFFELDTAGTIVWHYVNPVNNMGPRPQGTAITNSSVFRCTRYPASYPAFNGHTLTPQGYLESGSLFSCTTYPTGAVDAESPPPAMQLFPQPAADAVTVVLPVHTSGTVDVTLYTLTGEQVLQRAFSVHNGHLELDVRSLDNGLYVFRVESFSRTAFYGKILVAR